MKACVSTTSISPYCSFSEARGMYANVSVDVSGFTVQRKARRVESFFLGYVVTCIRAYEAKLKRCFDQQS